MNSSHSVIMNGDLNLKHPFWNCKTKNYNGTVLYNYSNSNNLTIEASDCNILYPSNNEIPSIVGIAILKNILYATTINTINDLDSDHLPIVLEVKYRSDIDHKKKTFLKYKDADWNKFEVIINDELVIKSNLKITDSIDRNVVDLTNLIKKAIDLAIPKIEYTPNHTPLPQDII